MPTFYHYTDDKGAKNIIRSGTIQASLEFMLNGDVAYGNGVYLTALSPEVGKFRIAQNNWQASWSNANKPSTYKKLKNYFILDIPDSEIEDTHAERRSIFLFGNSKDLQLNKYKWVLKDFDTGTIIASYKYNMASLTDPARPRHVDIIGDYIMTDVISNGRPVYKGPILSLFVNSKGDWMLGENVGKDTGYRRLNESFSVEDWELNAEYPLGPDCGGEWKYEDGTFDGALKMHAYGGMVFSFDKLEGRFASLLSSSSTGV